MYGYSSSFLVFPKSAIYNSRAVTSREAQHALLQTEKGGQNRQKSEEDKESDVIHKHSYAGPPLRVGLSV